MANIIKFGGGAGGSGNAAAADLLAGKTATVDTGEITGTMPNIIGVTTLGSGSTGKWPDGALAVYLPTTGKYTAGLGNSEIKVPTAQLQSADVALVAGNIKKGVNIFGVVGNYASGMVNLSTDANGNTGTSANLGAKRKLVGVTMGGGLNTRNFAATLVLTVQGSSNGGASWVDLLTASVYSGFNSKASVTNSAWDYTGEYNMFRIVSNLVDSYWEFLYYGHATVVVV